MSLFKRFIKILIFAILDAIAVWSAISLYTQHAYIFLLMLLLGTVLLNLVYWGDRLYPLKYILPGTLFMLMLVVYPIFYTVYISFTNYGTGHILSREQVVEQLENRYYLPQDAQSYSFVPFEKDGDFIVLLEDAAGNMFLGLDGQLEKLEKGDPRLIDQNNDGEIELINGYQRLGKKDLFKNLSRLQELEFGYQDRIIKMKNFSSFAEYIKQFQYLAEENKIVDLKEGVTYLAKDGYFVSPDGQRLDPGFRSWVGWENFLRLLRDERISGPFFRVFIWTFEWAFLSVLTTFSLGLLLALLLNDKHLKFKGIYRAILVLPYAIPAFISALVWRGLFDETVGVINNFLIQLFGSGLPWMTDPFWTKTALVIVNLWLGFPYMMLISLGALQSIPEEHYEAAAIDGANLWQQFRYITLPMLMVSVAPLLVSSFAFNFNNFIVIYLFNRGRPAMVGAQTPAGTTDILISYTYRLSFEGGRGSDFGLASAVTIIIFIITAVITYFNFRYTGALEDVKENV